MSQQTRLGTHATTIQNRYGIETVVRYHTTEIVRFSNERIELNTGGWRTATTKTRLNQASVQFGLGYHVHQKNYAWFVTYGGNTHRWNEPIFIIGR